MAKNYASQLPQDEQGISMQELPTPFPAVARVTTENAVSSSVISLNPNTTSIEIGVIGGTGAVIRWVPLTETAAVAPFASAISSGLGANFDHLIPAGTYRRFVIPRETQGAVAGQAGSIHGLYQRVARINATTVASSVLVSEF